MSNPTLKLLLKQYDQLRLQKQIEYDQKINHFYQEHPKVLEINDKINKQSIEISKAILFNKDANQIDTLTKKLDQLKKEKKDLLHQLNISEDFFMPDYACKLCHDTGYLIDNNNVMCTCLKQKLLDAQYNHSNIFSLQKENFDCFNSSLFSDQIDEKKYNASISPRENIEKIKEIALHFIHHFDDFDQKNLLFTGNTGLGKTFLTNCIANEMLKKGKNVLYQTAPVMLDSIIDYKFGKEVEFHYQDLLNTDLLIIDDLGTENVNNLKLSELFNILNTRLLNQNHRATKTIISTNLSLNNLFKTYDERIFSRLVGYYDICRFFGEDLRYQKMGC